VAARYREAVIRKEKGEYCVRSPDNPDWNGGCYPTEGEAKKRLQQVEFFKHKKSAAGLVSDPDPSEFADAAYGASREVIRFLNRNLRFNVPRPKLRKIQEDVQQAIYDGLL